MLCDRSLVDVLWLDCTLTTVRVPSVASAIEFHKGVGMFPDPDARSLAERVQDVVTAPVVAGLHSIAASNLEEEPPDEDAVRLTVSQLAGAESAARLTFEQIAAKDWVAASLAEIKPVEAGRFIVHGAHDRARVAANRIGIEIEAALAFGTGHHGTTRGCLLALDWIWKGSRPKRR